ncbi:MAG: flagellar motor protein, partial [Rhodocyclaceae bacterium]|nr:flagellar motor protein [Rhodocyclaceae bacterium]
MDKISIAGLALGILAILGGQVLEGGHVGSLVQPTAFLIVIGGTLGAVMLQSPLAVFVTGLKMVKWVFVPPPTNPEQVIEQMVRWSHV